MKAKYKIEIALGTILIGAITGVVYFSITATAANLWTYEQKFNGLNTASIIGQDGWVLTTGVDASALVVETGTPYEGTKHLTLIDDRQMRIYRDVPSVVSGTMYVSIKIANSTGWTRFSLDQGAVNGYAIDLYFNGSNSNIQSPYNGANIQAYTGATWYRVGIQFETGAGGWEGLAADTYKINVNGGAWSSAMNFQGLAVTGIDRIKLESVVDIHNGNNQSWFDYISPNYAPAPSTLYVGYPSAQSGSANPVNFAYSTPFFSAINNNGESVNKYRVQLTLASDTGFTSPVWDSGGAGVNMSLTANTVRSPDIFYGGSTLLASGTNYIWRIQFYGTSWGSWSTESATIGMTTGALTARFYSGNNGDSFLQSSVGQNYANGSETNMSLQSYAPANGWTGRPIIKFTLPTGTGTISDVQLYIYSLPGGYRSGSSGGIINIHQMTRDWTESAVTWNKYDGINVWTTGGGDYSATVIDSFQMRGNVGSYGTPGWEPAIVLMGIGATNPLTLTWSDTVNLIIKDSSETDSGANYDYTYYATKEYATDTSKRPYLLITYAVTVPSPTTGNIIFFGGD